MYYVIENILKNMHNMQFETRNEYLMINVPLWDGRLRPVTWIGIKRQEDSYQRAGIKRLS